MNLHMKELRYRRIGEVRFFDPWPGCGFFYCTRPRHLYFVKEAVRREFGSLGLLKAKLKLLFGPWAFYGVYSNGRLQHYGWVTFGFSRRFRFAWKSAVIGPVWTAENERGQGLATTAMKQAINAIIERGFRRIYVQTTDDNAAFMRVIERCGFHPIGTRALPQRLHSE